MEKRKLGQSSLRVPPITLGCNVFGWTVDEASSFALLDAALDAGLNFLDTADVYARWHPGNSGGESETIIGKWLKTRNNRDRVIVATKLGIEMAPGRKGLSRQYMQLAVEDSLRRLQTDYIDLYQSLRDDPDTPIEETLSAYADLVRQGKIREIGASNFSADRLADSLHVSAQKRLPRYQSLQPRYSLVERADFEGPLEDVCLREKVGVIGYSSLASGFLTGKYRSQNDTEGRERGPGAGRYLNEYGLGVLRALDEVARRYEAKPGQVALAWLIARPSVTAPIASATNLEQLAELAEAADIELDADSIHKLDEPASRADTARLKGGFHAARPAWKSRRTGMLALHSRAGPRRHPVIPSRQVGVGGVQPLPHRGGEFQEGKEQNISQHRLFAANKVSAANQAVQPS